MEECLETYVRMTRVCLWGSAVGETEVDYVCVCAFAIGFGVRVRLLCSA